MQPIVMREQRRLEDADLDYIKGLSLDYDSGSDTGITHYLGLSCDGWSSYYVGAVWLKEGCRPLVVLPKFDRMDFIKILADALNAGIAPKYFNDAYSINFDAPVIQESSLNSVLSPLLVSHFLSVVSRLLKKGLKRNYIICEENLKCKIKGHILAFPNLQKNVIRGHVEKVLCRYQDYSLDYPENQIIKRALLASESMLLSMKSSNNELLKIVRKTLISFQNISSDITPAEVKSIRRDKLHGEYPLAINLAKQILHRTDFSISDCSSTIKFVPEFAIDMSRIFEFYVLSLLRTKYQDNDILFQEDAGIMGRCDFLILSEHLIIDAKYKDDYPHKSNDVKRADIREVTGYGRSTSILKKLGIDDWTQPECIIIYPNGEYKLDEKLSDNKLTEQSEPIDGVHNFYTLGVSLPSIK